MVIVKSLCPLTLVECTCTFLSVAQGIQAMFLMHGMLQIHVFVCLIECLSCFKVEFCFGSYLKRGQKEFTFVQECGMMQVHV